MNLIAWPMGLGLLVILMTQAVVFHKATVCRQEAWLKSTELLTNALITKPLTIKREWHLGCRLHLIRDHDLVTWQRLPELKKIQFKLPLNGSL